MYFWNVRSLKNELAHGLTPQQSLQYVIGLAVTPVLLHLAASLFSACVLAIVGHPEVALTPEDLQKIITSHANESWLLFDASTTLAEAAALTIGLRYCYRQNGGPGGAHLLPRLAALAWVSMIRTFVLLVIPAYCIFAIVWEAGTKERGTPSWPWMLAPTLAAAVTLTLAGNHIGDVARRSGTQAVVT